MADEFAEFDNLINEEDEFAEFDNLIEFENEAQPLPTKVVNTSDAEPVVDEFAEFDNLLDNDPGVFKEPVDPNKVKFEEIPSEFNTTPIFQEPPEQKPGPEQLANAQNALPPPVFQAVNTYLLDPFKRAYDNTGAGLNSFSHMFYTGLREVSKVVEDTIGSKHNASDFFDKITKDIAKSNFLPGSAPGIEPVSKHWSDQVVFMVANALPSAALGIEAGVVAQNAARTIAGASSTMAPAMARFMGEAGVGAFEGIGRAGQSGQDLTQGAAEGAAQFGLFEVASSFGSRYGKAFQIGFSTSLGAAVAALSPNATKDDIAASAILGAVFAIPGRTQSGDYKTDFGNIMSWVKNKRAKGLDPTPAKYIEENLPSSIEENNVSQMMEPMRRNDKSPHETFKEGVAKELGIDPSKITNEQMNTKLAQEMDPKAAAALSEVLKRESDIWVAEQTKQPEKDTISNLENKIKVKKSELEQVNSKIESNAKKGLSGDINSIVEANILQNKKSKLELEIDTLISDKNRHKSFKQTLGTEVPKEKLASQQKVIQGETAASPKDVAEKSLNDIVTIQKDGIDIKVQRRVASKADSIERQTVKLDKLEKEAEALLIEKPAERLAKIKRNVGDAFLNIERRLEAEYEKVPEGRNILALRNIQNSSTSISEFNVNDAFEKIGLRGKNKMSEEMIVDFRRTADALTQIDKLRREPEYKSPASKGKSNMTNQDQIDHYEYIVAKTKAKHGNLEVVRGEDGVTIKGDTDLSNRLDTYFGIFQKYLKDAHTSGLFDAESYNSMKNIVYSPTQYMEFLKKQLDFDPDFQRQQLFETKRLGKGKDDVNITSPEYLLSGHINRFDYMIAKNNQLNATYDFIMRNPENFIGRIEKTEGFSKEVAFKKDGKLTKMYLQDDLGKAYKADSLFSDHYGNLIKTAHTVSGSSVVKTFATGAFNPTYFMAAIPRDFFFFNMTNHWKGQSNFIPYDIAVGAKGIALNAKDILKNGAKTERFIKAGGSSGIMANEMRRVAFARRNSRFIGPQSKVDKIWDKAIDKLTRGNQISEMAVRMHFADLIYKNGNQLVGFNPDGSGKYLTYEQAVGETARMLDFRRRGAAAELLETAVPYFNTTVQSIERFHNGASKHNKALYSAKLAQWIGASYMLTTFPYWMAEITDDEDQKQQFLDTLKNIPMEQSLREAIIPIGYSDEDRNGNRREYYFSVKKERFPLTVALDYIMQAGMREQFLGQKPDEDLYQEIVKEAIPFDLHQFVPPTWKAARAIWFNEDITNNRPVTQNKNIPPNERIKNASNLAQLVGHNFAGQALGVSPEGIDVAARAVAPSSFLRGMLGITINISPEAERDLARAFVDSPVVNQFIKRTTLGSRLMRDLEERGQRLMTAQQQKVNQPVVELIERMKFGEVTIQDAAREIRNSDLSRLEKVSAIEKLKTFSLAEAKYKKLSSRREFKDKNRVGFLSSWRKYYSLYVQLSDPKTGEDAADYVVSNFLSVGDDPNLKRAIKDLGLAYLPLKHRGAFIKEFEKLTKEK